MVNTYLSFLICEEQYAVNVTKVLEVLQKQRITKVPNAPNYIKGIINFRGEVVPVFESRTKFGLPEREEGVPFVIIVLDFSKGAEAFRIGSIVDKVKDVISVNDQDIKPVPVMSKDFNSEFLEGIYKQNDDFIMMLDVEKVFTRDEIDSLKEANSVEEMVANS
jgi:purine-binding chemotaxis protein CheW